MAPAAGYGGRVSRRDEHRHSVVPGYRALAGTLAVLTTVLALMRIIVMSTSRRRGLAALTTAALGTTVLLAGCSAPEPVPEGTLDVMASFYPLQFATEQVGGDRVAVSSLTPPGAEPHDVELSPAQVAHIGDADLVVYLSGFQPAVDEAVELGEPARVLDAAEHATLEATGESHDEHADEEERDHGPLDPHFWLDPELYAAFVEDVRAELTAIDPEGADEYAANAAALTASLDQQDADYVAGLAACESRTIVVSHAAFGYLASRYDLEQVAISGLDPESEPSPARLAEVADVVEAEGVTTIFFETLVSSEVADSLADDLGVQTAVLDPIEGVTDDDATYLTIAAANLEALRVALSCS